MILIDILAIQYISLKPFILSSQAVVHDIESKQTELDAMRRQMTALLRDLSPAERSALEVTLSDLSSDYCRLVAAADTQRKLLAQQVARREALQRDVERAQSWLGEREEGLRQTATVRLRAADVEKDIERYKVSRLFCWFN